MPLQRPFAVGLGLFGLGLADRRPRPVDAGARRRPLPPGPRRRAPWPRRRTSRSAAACRSGSSRACSRCCPRRGWCPGSSARRWRPSWASWPGGAGCSWGCCRSWPWPAGWPSTPCATCPPRRSPPRATSRARGATCAASAPPLAAAAGAGLLVAGLGATEPLVLVAGAILGVAILVPAFRWLTPPGTLRLAAGVPAAVLLRGLMTFSFFAADAYIALLLQTWRGTPARAHRRRVHGDDDRLDARARGCRRGGSTATGRAASWPSASPASRSAACSPCPWSWPGCRRRSRS